MKKFLISFIIGITMMAVGTTMLVFEIKDFEIVDGVYGDEGDQIVHKEFDVSKENLDIRFENGYAVSYDWKYDESMGDKVIVKFHNSTDYSVHGHTLRIKDIYYGEKKDGMFFLNIFLDGLKEKKFYTFDTYDSITITGSRSSRDKVNFVYDGYDD